MKLTREEALKLHREMWGEMKNKLGDNPACSDRVNFKREWCKDRFGDEDIEHNCFLCEFACYEDYNEYWESSTGCDCSICPIDWGNDNDCGCEDGSINWQNSFISDILALPERIMEE